MSLSQPSDGYLRTCVALQDVEEKMKQAFPNFSFANANLQEKENVDGNTSLMATFEYDHHKFLLKLPTRIKLNEFFTPEISVFLEELTKTIHNREMEFYTSVLPHCRTLKTPKFVCGKKFEGNSLSAFIVMELSSGRNLFTHEFVGIEGTRQIMDSLAALHAVSANISPEKFAKLADTPKSIANIPSILLNENRLKEVCEQMPKFVPNSAEIFADIQRCAVGQKLITPDVFDKVSEELKMSKVLVHADFWKGNILFADSATGVDLSAILDWQCWHPGNPGEDLARLYLYCLSVEDKEKHWADLLQFYFQRYQFYLSDAEKGFSFDQLQNSIRLCLPACAMIVLGYVQHNYECDKKKGVPEENWLSNQKLILHTLHHLMTEVRDILVTIESGNK